MAESQPLIDQFQLTSEIHHFAEEYSRGMKKKLGLLLALLHRPKLLILDEPTNGLDVEDALSARRTFIVVPRRGFL